MGEYDGGGGGGGFPGRWRGAWMSGAAGRAWWCPADRASSDADDADDVGRKSQALRTDDEDAAEEDDC